VPKKKKNEGQNVPAPINLSTVSSGTGEEKKKTDRVPFTKKSGKNIKKKSQKNKGGKKKKKTP